MFSLKSQKEVVELIELNKSIEIIGLMWVLNFLEKGIELTDIYNNFF